MSARLARLAGFLASWVAEHVDNALWGVGLVVKTTEGHKRAMRNAFEVGRDLGRLECGGDLVERDRIV